LTLDEWAIKNFAQSTKNNHPFRLLAGLTRLEIYHSLVLADFSRTGTSALLKKTLFLKEKRLMALTASNNMIRSNLAKVIL